MHTKMIKGITPISLETNGSDLRNFTVDIIDGYRVGSMFTYENEHLLISRILSPGTISEYPEKFLVSALLLDDKMKAEIVERMV